jgi:hypothetical protein
MKRTTIFLPESLERDLQSEARRTGRPMASLVREALAEYVVARRPAGNTLSFVGCGAGAATDVAERHEELLWTRPHGAAAAPARRTAARRKAR